MRKIQPDRPFKIVATVTIEHPDFEMDLIPSNRKAVAQISMTGELMTTGIAFTCIDAATDFTAPEEVHKVIESVLPIMGETMRGIRTGQVQPDVAERRYYDGETGERMNLDS